MNQNQKIDAWKRFFTAVSTDNPHSVEDDDMRTYAKSRMKHWQRVKTPKKETPVPKVAAIDPKEREIGRDDHYIAYANGIVRDTKTGLEWLAGPDKDTSWNEAKQWVESLTKAGGGWRMPTMGELERLYQKGKGSRNMTPLLKTTGFGVWSGETKGSTWAWGFDFTNGYEAWLHRSLSITGRAFAVRSQR